ncbi:MAG TPA: hypothetical protein PLG43_07955 [Spirochaetia bacterium]|nr:hypothetical protein [Spirochaetia bacterium]
MISLITEAKELIEAAREEDFTVRLLGGCAVAVLCEQSNSSAPIPEALKRDYSDMDLALLEKRSIDFETFMKNRGFIPEERFNTLNGDRRLLFRDSKNGRKVDVFVANFEMCHLIPFSERLKAQAFTLPPAELLLTKLQIVKINRKDVQDVLTLLLFYSIGTKGEGIDADTFGTLTGNDWGLWKTVGLNITKIQSLLDEFHLSQTEAQRIETNLDTLAGLLATYPKTTKWKMRSLVGERVRWYEEPEEAD